MSLTIASVLKNVSKEITAKEAQNLADLKFHNGESKLSMKHSYFTYEILWLLKEVGYEKTYNFLSADWEKVLGEENIRKKMLFENPLMTPAKDKFILDMHIYKEQISVEAGEKCKRCGSVETISIAIQSRAADEAVNIKLYCVSCKLRWNAQ